MMIPILGMRVTTNFGYHLKKTCEKNPIDFYFRSFYEYAFSLTYFPLWFLSCDSVPSDGEKKLICVKIWFALLHFLFTYLTQWHFERNESCVVDTFSRSDVIIPSERSSEFKPNKNIRGSMEDILNNNNYPSGMRPIAKLRWETVRELIRNNFTTKEIINM